MKRFFIRGKIPREEKNPINRFLIWLYHPLLDLMIRFRWAVILTAAVRSFWTKTLDALGVQPDASYAELEPDLREVLVVGRPIAES